jgi:hypothetical protein
MTALGSLHQRLRGAGLVLALVGSPGAGQAWASESPLGTDIDAVARVTTSASELRAGPGLSYRVIHRAERGESFPIQGREATGFWLRVYLPDGRSAYLLGDSADTVLLDDLDGSAPGSPGFFSPPPLDTAHGGFSMSGGLFAGSGYAELKPALVVNRSLSLEPYLGLVLSRSGRSLLYGAGATLNVTPDWPVAPYLHLGGGGFTSLPNEDAFALRRQTLFHARAGGGLLTSLRWRIVLRLEATNTVLFDADSYRNAQSYVAGLGSYF